MACALNRGLISNSQAAMNWAVSQTSNYLTGFIIVRNVFLTAALAAVVFAAQGQEEWALARPLRLPGYVPVFAATTPTGDVVVTTFNSSSGRGPQEIPVVLIHKPLGPGTQYFVVCRDTFDENRGYSGVAVDSEGCYFVAGDTGNPQTSFIRKHLPNGQLDAAFGAAGQVLPGKRVLGLDLTGRHLFTTLAFGELVVLDRQTGSNIGSAPPAGQNPNIRDIAVNPSNQTIYGVAQGAVWIWEGGSFDKPTGYRLRRLSEETGVPRAGEGIAFDPASQRALMPDSKTGSLLTIGSSGPVRGSRIADPTVDRNSLADAVLMQDGSTLLVTDMTKNSVFIMNRTARVDTVAAGSAAGLPGLSAAGGGGDAVAIPSLPTDAPVAAVPTAAPTGTGVAWVQSFESAKAQAAAQGKPMLLYARAEGVAQCATLEQGLLKSPEFAGAAGAYVCCFFDAGSDRQLAQQLGIFKVPAVAVYTAGGDRKAMISGTGITADSVAKLAAAP